MTGVAKAEHAKVYVEDVDDAIEFYANVMGMVELDRSQGTAYLGCGLNANYDLALEEGSPGLDHVAVRADDEASLDRYEERLEARDVEVERTDGSEFGQRLGIRFELPSGIPLEVVIVQDNDFRNQADAADSRRRAGAPLDLHHIGLMPADVRRDAEFLEETLDFKTTQVGLLDDEWNLGFTRYGDLHHDFSMIQSDDPGDQLHHIAWEMIDVGQLVHLVDRVVDYGYLLETPIIRHSLGDNLATYFQGPYDHRFELETGMATCNQNTPTTFVDLGHRDHSFQTWEKTLKLADSYYDGT